MGIQQKRKPHLFVGSSSEQLDWARAIQDELDHDAEVTVWPQGVFRASATSLNSLMAEAKRSDFSVFVFTPDDIALIRKESESVVRDNVIFELGLFIGELGHERCFLIAPRNRPLHMPTDLLGLTPLDFEPERSDGNRTAAVGRACNAIRQELRQRGFRDRPTFSDHTAVAKFMELALAAERAGLEHTYASRAEAVEDIRASIRHGGEINLLSNKGDDWLAEGGAASKTFEDLKATGPRFDLKTILLHRDSSWLKGEGLRFLKRSREQAVAEFTEAHDKVELWCAKIGCPAPRYHRHHPSWRFIQTADALFISTYVTHEQISLEPMLRFSPQSPIYRSVTRYFSFLYDYCSATRGNLSRSERFHDKAISLEASAGIVVTRGSGKLREVLLVKRAAGEMALPKGHIEGGEAPIDAAARELLEETGMAVTAQSLSFFKIRPVAYILPDELVMKALLFYRLDESGGAASIAGVPAVDPSKACWQRLSDLDDVTFVDGYIREMLTEI